MLEYINRNQTAIIVLHEIYGINHFIKGRCQKYHAEGYDVFCPDLYSTKVVFPYAKADEAYDAYRRTVGFEAYQTINLLASNLKQTYAKVVVIGFSVGATVAWRCSESAFYDGIICCYGSRIRDYLTVAPKCPVLLVFAKQDSFDVVKIAAQLRSKKSTVVEIIEGKHGFADCYCENYCQSGEELFNKLRQGFLASYTV